MITENNPFYQLYHTALDSLRVSNTEQAQASGHQEGRAILDVCVSEIVG